MKKKITHNQEFMKASEVGVLIEEFRSETKAFAENQKAMDEKFTNKFNMLFEEMGRQREDIWVLKADVRVLKEDMKIVKTDVAEIKNIIHDHGDRISKVEEIVVK